MNESIQHIVDILTVSHGAEMVRRLDRLTTMYDHQELVEATIAAFPLTNSYDISRLPIEAFGVAGSGGAVVRTFNLSTVAALIASCVEDIALVKTGSSYSATKLQGPMTTLANAGVKLQLSLDEMLNCLDTYGFLALPSANAFHWMFYLQELLTVPFFNDAIQQYTPMELPFTGKVNGISLNDKDFHYRRFKKSDMMIVALVHGVVYDDFSVGIDDVSTVGKTICYRKQYDKWEVYEWLPHEAGLNPVNLSQITLPDQVSVQQAFFEVLSGVAPKPWLELAAYSAAMVLFGSGKRDNLQEGVRDCYQALIKGYGQIKLRQIISYTTGCTS